MSPFVWATDTHFDHATSLAYKAFVDEVRQRQAAALLFSGDISNAIQLEGHLRSLAEDLPCPIYFILGNHDFYGSSVAAVRAMLKELCAEFYSLHYLSNEGPVLLKNGYCLIGQDGWADGRSGNYRQSSIVLNDGLHITDLMGKNKEERLVIQQGFADSSARELEKDIRAALKQSDKVAILTHLPPFREACLYDDLVSDSDWAPHFVCTAIGDILTQAAKSHPEAEFVVFCGHSHHAAEYSPLSNLSVYCGFAEYGQPFPQERQL